MSSLIVIFMAVSLAVLQAALVPTLGGPLSMLQLPLILVIGLVTGFRFREAFLAALTGGSVLGVLTAPGPATALTVMLISTVVVISLFTRVLSHRSLSSFVGINAAGFLLYYVLAFLIGLSAGVMNGNAMLPRLQWSSLSIFAVGLVLQTIAAGLLLVTAKKVKKRFLSMFFVVR